MSRGQSQMRTRSARTALKRCKKRSHKNTIIIDVDIGVIIVESPESSSHKSRCSKDTDRKHLPTVICIEEDDDSNDDTSSKSFHPFSSNSYGFEEFESDECQILNMKGKSRLRSDGCPKRMFGIFSSECSTSKADTSKRDILDTEDLEDDCSDCEIIDDSSVDIREEWEKAALKKKAEKRNSDSKEGMGAFWPHMSGVSPCETSGNTNFNRTNFDTGTFQEKGGIHSDPNALVDRTDDLSHTPDISNGFRERDSTKFKGKNFVKASDHIVDDDSCSTCDFENKNEMPTGKSSPWRCHSQAGVAFDHATTSNQDEQHQGPLSQDPCMNGPMDNKDNQRASIFTTELRSDPQFEDMQRYERLSPCNVPCSSQNIPVPQRGNVTEVAEDSYCPQPQDGCAPSEPTDLLHEQQIDMLHTHSEGEEEANFQGSTGNIEGDMNPVIALQSNVKNMDIVSESNSDLIGERERLKESDEYKRAEEEEWASRQRELLIQSEEAQKLRKRKKAEILRLLDTERRQKQRLEEIRESQKRDEETVKLKDQIRLEIQKELEKLEMKYRDMASLLRSLGISICGGPYPLPHEVNAAYKQALLRFHPDRASRTNIRQQVEAEEKFKLISRLKEKLLPVAH